MHIYCITDIALYTLSFSPSFSLQDNNAIVRTFGEESKKKYSHVDLISMIGGVDSKRGAVTSGEMKIDFCILYVPVVSYDLIL